MRLRSRIYATVAQQVEQFTRNEQVASSNLASSSTYRTLVMQESLFLSLLSYNAFITLADLLDQLKSYLDCYSI